MKVLIIIDMLNGFCREGYPLSLPVSASETEDYIVSRIKKTNEEGGKVIFVCDNHTFADPEIGDPYPPHCMAGTEEAEIVDTLLPFAKNAIVLKKHTMSILLNTGLEEILMKLNPEEIEIAGVCTDICDLFAVYELRIRGYHVFVSPDGVLALEQDKQEVFLDYYKRLLGARVGK